MKIQGDILVIDPTGRIMPELQKAFDPDRMQARRKEEAQKALIQASAAGPPIGGRGGAGNWGT